MPGSTVMIVEDFDDTREMLKLMLEMKGLSVVEAIDGREAVDLAKSIHPDLILMDLSLPVMDGITATRLIVEGEKTSTIPVVAVSAHCRQKEWHERAEEAGCLGFIDKPVDFDALDKLLCRFQII